MRYKLKKNRYTMKSLLITLGHNSSAIFIDEQVVHNRESQVVANCVIGYEQERLSKIKSDSSFPIDAVFEIIKNVGLKRLQGCKIYISHWFNFCDGPLPEKYISDSNLKFLSEISQDIVFVNKDFTHHDAHAYSAMAFYHWHANEALVNTDYDLYTIVADGFGNNEEVISVYKTECSSLKRRKELSTLPIKLVHRAYGYEASLGLMYQYATAFCGMKENQDEYKFLGYESHIDDDCINFRTSAIEDILKRAQLEASNLFNLYTLNTKEPEQFTPCDTDKLQSVRNKWYNVYANVLCITGLEDPTRYASRVAIGFFVQSVIEKFFAMLIDSLGKNISVLLAGGCFYNVKLNNLIIQSVNGNISIVPVAGDQGAAIGMYYNFENCKFPFSNLSIGVRDKSKYKKLFSNKRNVHLRGRNDKAFAEIAEYIAAGKIVNIICGDMEFGPRALCNTSTLMLPTAENVAFNNRMNKRNEVMPCAPVCTKYNTRELFDANELNRVIGSDKFMICTHTYKRGISSNYAGVMHKLPNSNAYSGRPQIVYDGYMRYILEYLEKLCDTRCIVNTSFNAHGRPIVFSAIDILRNFEFQLSNCDSDSIDKLHLFIIN